MSVTSSQKDFISMEVTDGSPEGTSGISLGNKPKRTGERRLVGALVCSIIVCFGLTVGLVVIATNTGIKGERVCMTWGCIEAAHMFLNNMDRSANPCEDFYQFACGGFEKRIRIPDDRSRRSQFDIIGDRLLEQLKSILEQEPEIEESPVFTMARDVYKACMNEALIERIGLDPLKSKLHSMGGWPVLEGTSWNETGFSWIDTVYTFRRHGYSTDYLIDFSIITDWRNSSWRVINIDQPSLGINQVYLNRGLQDQKVAAYLDYMINVAVLLGADRVTARKEMTDALEFEMQLAAASMTGEDRRNLTRLYNPVRIRDLSDYAPMVPWLEYINNILTEEIIQVSDTERVLLYEPGYLRNLTLLLPTVSKRTLANYMYWRVAAASLAYFTKAAQSIQLEYSKKLTGKVAKTSRWRVCTGFTSQYLDKPLGNMYVRKHFNEDSKQRINEMVTDIRKEMEIILTDIEWMDDKTRGRALDKLRAMKEYIGYPQEILQQHLLEQLYQGLEVKPDAYFNNSFNIGKWAINYSWSKLREKVDKTDWKTHSKPAVVNAFYNFIENSIQFPAGILQGNFFSSDHPAYMNYGAIGWVIGHEITHGFDDQGRQFDDTGNFANWWEDDTKDKFLEKTNCIIQQYGNYTARAVNLPLSGINTQGENIADNGGLKEAYRAYDSWVSRHGEEAKLPGLQEYSTKQLFWISAANTWCAKYRDKSLENAIRTGKHSPSMFRVMGPFSNSREFSHDYQCPLGTPMNPVHKCEVW